MLRSRLKGVKVLLITTLTVFIAGCDMEFSALPNEPILLAVNKSGVPVYERQLDSVDAVRLAINHWFVENPDGWEYAYRHRSPHILLTGTSPSNSPSSASMSILVVPMPTRGFISCMR